MRRSVSVKYGFSLFLFSSVATFKAKPPLPE
jgi:hypothetical protein